MEEVRLIEVKKDILADKKGFTDELHAGLKKTHTPLLNRMSSPGAGMEDWTAWLEREARAFIGNRANVISQR